MFIYQCKAVVGFNITGSIKLLMLSTHTSCMIQQTQGNKIIHHICWIPFFIKPFIFCKKGKKSAIKQ